MTYNLNFNADLFFIKNIIVSPSTYKLTLKKESSSIFIQAENEGEFEIEIKFENKQTGKEENQKVKVFVRYIEITNLSDKLKENSNVTN